MSINQFNLGKNEIKRIKLLDKIPRYNSKKTETILSLEFKIPTKSVGVGVTFELVKLSLCQSEQTIYSKLEMTFSIILCIIFKAKA